MSAVLVAFARTASEHDKLRAASSQEFQPRLREQLLSLLSARRFVGDFVPPSDNGHDVRETLRDRGLRGTDCGLPGADNGVPCSLPKDNGGCAPATQRTQFFSG